MTDTDERARAAYQVRHLCLYQTDAPTENLTATQETREMAFLAGYAAGEAAAAERFLARLNILADLWDCAPEEAPGRVLRHLAAELNDKGESK